MLHSANIILNFGDKDFASGLTYTAISRVTKLENIAFDYPFPNLKRFTNIFKTKKFRQRLSEEKRLSQRPKGCRKKMKKF